MSRHKTCYVISYHGILCHDMSYVTTIAVPLIYTVNYHYICYCFHFESILYTIIITIYNYIAIRTLAMKLPI